MQQIYEYVDNHSTFKWAQKFLNLLKCCKPNTARFQYIKMGMGLTWQVIKSNIGFKQLDNNLLFENY